MARHRLTELSSLVQLEPVLIPVGDLEVALVRIEDEVYSFAPMCTHRPGPLVNGAVTWKRRILCPWHLGTFDLRTGRAVAGPPERPLTTYPTEIVDGDVWLLVDPVPGSEKERSAPCPTTAAKS
jgi:nitrite reductase/ring-hydroxylating ferredoxin subunit